MATQTRTKRYQTKPKLRPVSRRQRSGSSTSDRYDTYIKRLQGFVGLTAALLSVAFIVAYGILRPANEQLYKQFGLAPEDVGLTETTIVASAGALAAIVALFFLSSSGSAYLAWKLGRWLDPRLTAHVQRAERWIRARPPKVRRILIPAACLGACTAALGFAFLLGLATRPIVKTSPSGGLIVLLIAINLLVGGMSFMVSLIASDMRTVAARASKAIVAGASVGVLGFALISVASFWQQCIDLGSALMSGKYPNSEQVSDIQWLQFRATAVRIFSKDDPLRLCDANTLPILIGPISDKSYVLLFRKDQPSDVVRLDSSDYVVVVTTGTHEFSCGVDGTAVTTR